MHRILQALTIALLHGLSSIATASDESQLARKWFEREWAAATDLPDAPYVMVRWREEIHHPASDENLEALRQRSLNAPQMLNHPDRRAYEQALKYRTKGPTVQTITLWSDGAGRWRFNQDGQLNDKPFYTDAAMLGDEAWTLNPQQIEYIEVENPPRGRCLPCQENAFRSSMRLLSTGGMNYRRPWKLELENFTLTNSKWVATTTGPATQWTFEGTWDASTARGTVNIVKPKCLLPAPQEDECPSMSGVQYSDWVDAPTFAGRIARKSETFDAAGRLVRAHFVEAIESISEESFERLLTPPSKEQGDVLRGTITAAWINDFRPERMTETRINPDQTTTVRPVPPQATVGMTQPHRWWYLTGWVSVGVIFSVLIVLRLRRSP